MAQGDLTVFNAFTESIGDGRIDLDTDTIKLGLVDSVLTPLVTASDPRFTTGGTNYAANEVTGTNYTAGGATLTATWVLSGAVTTFTATGSPAASWTQHAAGPSDIRWGIIYSDTATNKDAIAFIVFGDGADISLIDGGITWTPNASGIFTLTRT